MATNAQVLEAIVALTDAVKALAPAQGSPATGKAKAPATNGFVEFIHERAAAKVACAIHADGSCNRKFMPTSRGMTNHVARIV